jgi:hypothetical protein
VSEPQHAGAEPGDGTGAGIVSFLDWAIAKNEILENSGIALRTGVRRVLETDDTLPGEDARTMNVDDIVRRFKNKQRGGKFKDPTLNDYERRFRQAVEMYRKWLDSDPSWRPAPRKTAAPRQSKPENASKPAQALQETLAAEPTAAKAVVQTDTATWPQMVKYPYPVRPGLLAHVELPADLTASEAERVAKFVASLAFDEGLAARAGQSGDPEAPSH